MASSGVLAEAQYEPDAQNLTHVLTTELAGVIGTEPTALTPLNRAVDIEAVERVVRSGVDADVRFTYESYTVVVRDGSIEIST